MLLDVWLSWIPWQNYTRARESDCALFHRLLQTTSNRRSRIRLTAPGSKLNTVNSTLWNIIGLRKTGLVLVSPGHRSRRAPFHGDAHPPTIQSLPQHVERRPDQCVGKVGEEWKIDVKWWHTGAWYELIWIDLLNWHFKWLQALVVCC